MNPSLAVAGGLATLVLTGLATARLIPHLERVGVIDEPNRRSSHSRPMPRGGGVALATLATSSAALLSFPLGTSADLFLVVGGSLALGLLGFADDIWGLGVPIRLSVQILVTALVLGVGVGWPDSWTRGGVVGLGVAFVVGSTNIFNFMDGIDGIAAGTGTVAGLVMVVVGFLANERVLVIVGVAWTGASAGFLTQNWSPARVFLGDAGSLFLGFSLSALVVLHGVERPAVGLALLAPLLPFLIDSVSTMIARAKRGERLTQAHRSHLYQRASRSWGHAAVATAYIASSLAAGLVVAAAGRFGLVSSLTAWTLCVASLTVAYMRLSASLPIGLGSEGAGR